MSGELTIRWPGGERTFTPGVEVRIGRDPTCQIVVDNPNVSRVHSSVAHDGTAWVLRDRNSSQGTFKDGAAVSEVALGGSQEVVLGAPQLGVHLTMAVAADEEPTQPRQEADATEVPTEVPERRQRPGGDLRSDIFSSATVVGGQSLRVECGGKTYQFSPGRRITVGRDEGADVVSTNPTVSRTHAAISHDGQGWRIEDAGSSAGTFIDGRQINTAPLAGTTAVWLGDPETGERLVIVTGGEKESTPIDRVRKLSRSGYLGVAAAAVAVVAVGVAVYALTTGASSEPLDRDQLARGVVRIETSEGGLGSGTVVDAEQGLILTSAHVAAPRALGQGVIRDLFEEELGQDPRSITVWVSEGLDQIAEPRFRAELAAADGYLDLAVLRITETVGGSLIEEGDLDELVAIPIGDSDDVESGDQIQIIGHPTVAQSNAATLTTGVLAGPVQDSRLESNRAYINLDADIRPGNSGGLVADSQGSIIGVPTLNWVQDSDEIGAMRPIGFATELLEAVRAEEPYPNPYVTPLTGDEELTEFSIGRSGDVGFRTNCEVDLRPLEAGNADLNLLVQYSDFPDGQHQDMAVAIIEEASGEFIGFTSSAYEWPVTLDDSGCFSVGLDLTRPLTTDSSYFADFFVGPNYEFLNGVTFDLGS